MRSYGVRHSWSAREESASWSSHFTHLSHQLWVIEHVWNLRVSLHQLLHLRIGHDHLPHQVRVGHHVLNQWVLHDLREHLRVGHELTLHLLLELHEVGRAHAQVGHTGQVTEATWGHVDKTAAAERSTESLVQSFYDDQTAYWKHWTPKVSETSWRVKKV